MEFSCTFSVKYVQSNLGMNMEVAVKYGTMDVKSLCVFSTEHTELVS